MLKKIISALMGIVMTVASFSTAVYAEDDTLSLGFDANKAWNNMVFVAYGTSGGLGDSARNFTMTNEYGQELSFTLVESYDKADAKYWILANDRYGTRAVGGSVKYDPTQENTIAKYVNEAFVQTNAWQWNLPKTMIDAIDYDHVWATERAYTGTLVPEAYTFTAGIVIPAIWEMEKYGDRIMIDVLAKYDANYMFRTAYGDSHYHALKKGSNETTADGLSRFKLEPANAVRNNVGDNVGIRPEFFLNEDFFKNAKINLATAGDMIKKEISKYSYADLSKIYTIDEITTYLPDVFVPSQSFDPNKAWNNMVLVPYGTSGGFGDASRNFTMINEYGTELSYTLVETCNEKNAKYWILANDLYGTHEAGGNVKYDPTQENTIAKYTNEAFVQSDVWKWNFPKSIIDAIDYDHVWATERAYTGTLIPEAYTFTAGVTIPAVWELEKYGDRIMIDVLPVYDANYMFRTAYGDSHYHALKKGSNETTATGVSRFKLEPANATNADVRGIRPEFYLKEDFFKNAKINLATAGSLIKEEILKYSYDDLSKVYTDAEIETYLGLDVPTDADVSVSWTDGENVLTTLDGVTEIVADITINSRVDEVVPTFVAMALYDNNKSLVGVNSIVTDMAANEVGKDIQLTLSGLTDITNDYTLKLFVWDNTTLKPRCESVTENFSGVESTMATIASVNMREGEQVFFAGTPVLINLGADGTFIWEIEDYYGNKVKKNLVRADGEKYLNVTLTGLEPGYYEVITYIKPDSEKIATDRTSFAIVEDVELIDDKDTSMFGINTHISGGYSRNTIDLLSDELYKLGVKNVRDHYSWAKVSTEEDVINFTDKDKAFVKELKRLGIGALMASGFNNTVYMGEDAMYPTTEKAISGFADYCKAVLDLFAENENPIPELEIWNEYWSWDETRNSPQNYATLFDAVYDRLITEYPELKMTVGFVNTSFGHNLWNWRVLTSGNVKNRLDFATVHAYVGNDFWESDESRPEVIGKVETAINDLKSILEFNGLGNLDIKLTETGCSSLPIDVNGDAIRHESSGAMSSKSCVTEKEAGMYLPRCVLIALSNGVKSVYPYQLTDGKYDLASHESFFGLLRGEGTVCGLYSPKPQYVSYATLIRVLDGTRFVSSEIKGDCYKYVFEGNGKKVTALYSIGNDMRYEYNTDDSVVVTEMMGKTKTVTPVDGKIELVLTGSVQYIIE